MNEMNLMIDHNLDEFDRENKLCAAKKHKNYFHSVLVVQCIQYTSTLNITTKK